MDRRAFIDALVDTLRDEFNAIAGVVDEGQEDEAIGVTLEDGSVFFITIEEG